MGNCLSCFKDQETSDNSIQNKSKDEVTLVVPHAVPAASPAANHSTQQQPLLTSEIDNPILSNQFKNETTPNIIIQQPQGDYCTDVVPKTYTSSEKMFKPFYQKLSSAKSKNNLVQCDSRVADARINQLFDQYKDSVEDAILAEGIENLCNDLQLNPDDFKVLVLAWKLNASQMCRFTKSEFTQGLKTMKTDSIIGIQQKLNDITLDLKDDSEQFKDLYRFTFKFGLDVSSGQRILPVDIATVLWRLVFTHNEPSILERWLHYIENNGHVRGIPKDTWYMFLNFCEFVGDDLSSYDDTEAWPSLFDDFVEYQNDQMNQNVTKNDFKTPD